MATAKFEGSWTALVTPFSNGRIDKDAVFRLLDRHLEAGTDGLVICGTTGESPTLSLDEKALLMETVVTRVAGKIDVMLGTGGNNTASAVELTRRAASFGAGSVLVVTPYYNKPSQSGLIAHFKEIAASTSLPVILYNVPGRTGVNMAPSTVLELARVSNIKGVKEASGNLEQAMDIIRGAPDGFTLLSGEDSLNLAIMALGGRGTISVTANVVPGKMKAFNKAALDGAWEDARGIHYELLPLHRAMFFESNPVPVKAALALQGLIADEFRLPLVPASKETREKLSAVMAGNGLLKG